MEEAEDLLRHAGGTAVVVFCHLLHGRDVGVGHGIPITGHRLPQLLQRHVVGIFVAGSLIGNELLWQGDSSAAAAARSPSMLYTSASW